MSHKGRTINLGGITGVGSYATVYINGVQVGWWKNEIDPTYLFLFSKSDIGFGSDAATAARLPADVIAKNEEYDTEACVLTVTAAALHDRLNALGLSTAPAGELFRHLQDGNLSRLRDWAADERMRDFVQAEELESLEHYSYDDWMEDVDRHIQRGVDDTLERTRRRDRTPFDQIRSDLEMCDPRLGLRCFIDGVAATDVVTLDVTDLVEGGWIEPEIDPHAIALEHYQGYLAQGGPAIVITEGNYDARVLKDAIRVLRPHLDGYIRFLDFSLGNEGGAAAGVKTIKAFAAAGVTNRTVLLLDNDTAAYDAVVTLKHTKLPEHYAVVHYPASPLAQRYPTIGPSGPAAMDVNGLAGSIEMYLGEDVLREPDGDLTPIQWTEYVSRLQQYQGVVQDKAGVQRRFEEKLHRHDQGESVDVEAWSGLELILNRLLAVLARAASQQGG
jgi:hypothetical protein